MIRVLATLITIRQALKGQKVAVPTALQWKNRYGGVKAELHIHAYRQGSQNQNITKRNAYMHAVLDVVDLLVTSATRSQVRRESKIKNRFFVCPDISKQPAINSDDFQHVHKPSNTLQGLHRQKGLLGTLYHPGPRNHPLHPLEGVVDGKPDNAQ